jgi:hypothetical protein
LGGGEEGRAPGVGDHVQAIVEGRAIDGASNVVSLRA